MDTDRLSPQWSFKRGYMYKTHGFLRGHITWNLTVDSRIGSPLVLWSIFTSNSGFGFSIAINMWPLSLAAGESSISITTSGSWVFLCALTLTSTWGCGTCLAGFAVDAAALAAVWACFSARSASTFLNSAATISLSSGSSSKLASKGKASCSGGSVQRTWASCTSSAISMESVETVNWIACLWPWCCDLIYIPYHLFYFSKRPCFSYDPVSNGCSNCRELRKLCPLQQWVPHHLRLKTYCLNTCSYLQLHPHPHLLHLLPDHLDASPHPLPALIPPPGQLLGECLPEFQSMQQQLWLQNLKHQVILAFQ